MTEVEEELVTIGEAAVLAGVTEPAIRNAIYRKKLVTTVRYGRKLLKRSDVLTYRATATVGRPKKQ